MAALPGTPSHIGRFQVLRPLGRGAQGTVWLAHDPQLQREVAIKSLNSKGTPDRAGLETLLSEAVMVSRLTHPNIVQLYDAGQEGTSAWLVFEFVEGRTLASLLREAGALAPGAAVPLLRQVLRALEYAHGKGVVHRDIKPGNVMVNADGTARVMDFGIAGWLTTGDTSSGKGFRGTPAYMAPEAIDGSPSGEAVDIFAAGMVLYEMLTGRTAAAGTTVHQTLHRIANVPFDPPSKSAPAVDGRLDGIVMRALAKNPAERFVSAQEFGAALDTWLQPPDSAPAAGEGPATVEFLLRRIRTRGDLPAFAETISAINHAARSGAGAIPALCESILKDFALASRLLRMANAGGPGQAGSGISTVTRAIMVLGFDRARAEAVAMMPFDSLQDRAQITHLKDEGTAAYVGGLLARELARPAGVRDAEEARIAAMFHSLGRMLTAFYLHDEYQEIRKLASAGENEVRAARTVLGAGYDDLGMAVARSWKLPERLVDSMRTLPGGRLRTPGSDEERLHALSSLSAELCGMIRDTPADLLDERIRGLSARYDALGLSESQLRSAVQNALRGIAGDAGVLSFRNAASPFFAKAPAAARQAHSEDLTITFDDPDAIGAPPGRERADASSEARRAALAAGIREVTEALMGDFQLNDVLRMILEAMHRGSGFDRALLCIRDPSANALKARMGLGLDAERIVREGFAVPLAGSRDLFQATLSQAADVCIDDTEDASIREHVPSWYRKAIGARALALFPVVYNKRPVALFYGDSGEPGKLRFAAEELAMLKTLRNQAVLAIRIQGG